MSKVVIRTDDLDGFFARAKDAARRADQSQVFEEKITLSFEDPPAHVFGFIGNPAQANE